MSAPTTKVAVLLFSRRPGADGDKDFGTAIGGRAFGKREGTRFPEWCNGNGFSPEAGCNGGFKKQCEGRSLQLRTALVERTRRTLRRSGLPIIHVHEGLQTGESFGERLSNALSRGFAVGYDKLLVVGDDCPQIQPSHLRAAARMLQDGKTVLGPDRRGGTYLIGLDRRDYDAETFAALPWETAGLFTALERHLPPAHTLRPLADLNVLEDLRRYWRVWRALLTGVAQLLTSAIRPTVRIAISSPEFRPSVRGLRGPPVAVAC